MTRSMGLLFVILSCLFLLSSSLPANYLSPHVRYVDDDSIDAYITNKHAITYLFVYSHEHPCPACTTVANSLINRAAKEFLGQVSFIAIDVSDKYSTRTAKLLNIDPSSVSESKETFPLLFHSPAIPSKDTSTQPTTQSSDDATPLTRVGIEGLTYQVFKTRVTEVIRYHSSVKQLDGATLTSLLNFKRSAKPKAILVTTKPETPSSWDALSHQFVDSYDFLIAQKTDRRVLRRLDLLNYDQFPAIVVIRRSPDDDHVKDANLEPILYSGIKKAPAIRAFLTQYLPSVDLSPAGSDVPGEGSSEAGGIETKMAALVQSIFTTHNPFIPAITDATCLKAHCTNNPNGGLCLMYILPRIATPHEIMYQIQAIRAIQELRAENGLNVMMLHGDASKQPILDVFEIAPQEYGQVVIFNHKKMITSVFLGAFTPDNLNAWIGDVLAGSAPVVTASITREDFEALFPSNASASPCTTIIEKREQYIKDEAAVKAKKSSPSQSKQQQQQQQQAGSDGQDRWVPPYRPTGKRGEVREMTDTMWESTVLKRSVPVLLQFLNRPPTPHDSNEKQEPKLSETPNELSDIENYLYVAKTLNSMVECFYVQCTPASSHIRSLFGVAEDGCTGGIYLIPPRAMVTPEYKDLKAIETDLFAHAKYYIVNPADVNPSLHQTFSTERLAKFALATFDEYKIHTLGSEPEAFQNWILQSVHEPRVLIFTAKSAPLLAKALALEFVGYASVAIVSNDNDTLKHQFQITTLPAIRVIRPVLKPRADASNQVEMSLEIIPIHNNQMYYNAIARVLDNIVTVRHKAVKAHKHSDFQAESDFDRMKREDQQERHQQERQQQQQQQKDEL